MNYETSIAPEAPSNTLVAFRFLVGVARRDWRILAVAFVIGLVLGFPLAWLVPQQYLASMTVTSARYSSESSGGGMSSGGGALSFISQISGSGSDLSSFDLYLKMMTSIEVSNRIFRDHPDLVHRIFRSEWQGDHWAPPHSFSFTVHTFVDRLLGISAWSAPDAIRLAATLDGWLVVSKDIRQPIAVIEVKSPDRQLALDVLQTVHDESEAAIKVSAQATRDANADYLASLLRKTSTISISDAVAESQVREEIASALSRSPSPFAAQYISPPNVPTFPDHKVRQNMPILMGLLGFIATLGYLLYREWRGRNAHADFEE